MAKWHSYAGKILRINLNDRSFKEEPLDPSCARKFLGGRGIGAKFLFDEVGPDVAPLSLENKIIIMTGPLTGTFVPGSARHVITTKSPLTGIYLNTVAGGQFGPQIKYSGYDGLIIEGKSDSPVYILITPDQKEIKDAKFVWGMTTDLTQEFIKNAIKEPSASVACIGPAGERVVPFACVINERRAAGRGGAGAVFGSKNLKAIAVHGTDSISLADEKSFKETLGEMFKKISSVGPIGVFSGYGSALSLHTIHSVGGFPTRNWQTGTFEGVGGLEPEKWVQKYRVKKGGCPRCPVACGHIVVVTDGPYAGAMTEGPEYEALYSLGGACGNSNIESIIAADSLCDKFGIDTIETGLTIAFAMECYQRKILTKAETGNLELTWGNHKAMVELIKKIPYRQDFGSLLAKGVKKLSEEIGRGSERYAMHVKGLALGGYDPRAVKGMGIGMAHAPRGGCHHNSTYTIYEEVNWQKVPSWSGEGKPELLKKLIHARMSLDLAPLCMFHWPVLQDFTIMSNLLSAATGIEFSINGLNEIGERVHNLERVYNVRLGLSRKEDSLPERLTEDPLPEGPAKGEVWDADLIDKFYEACGWDKRGIPTKDKLKSLGLERTDCFNNMR